MKFQELVKRLCRESGKTPIELAEIAECTRSWVDAWLAGRIKNPGVVQLEKLYEALTGKDLV